MEGPVSLPPSPSRTRTREAEDVGGSETEMERQLARLKQEERELQGKAVQNYQKGKELLDTVGEMQGSFRTYVKADFWQLNANFRKERSRVKKGTAAHEPERGSKCTVGQVTVTQEDLHPVPTSEGDVLTYVCGESSRGGARGYRVLNMCGDSLVHSVVKSAFWFVFVVAFQPHDEVVLLQLREEVATAWQRTVSRYHAAELLDDFAVVFVEAIFQQFGRTFPGSKNVFDDGFAVFTVQMLFYEIFGITIAPITVCSLRRKHFPTLLEKTDGGTSAPSEFASASSFAEPLSRASVSARISMASSDGFFTKSTSASLRRCASQSQVGGMERGMTIGFLPYVRKTATVRKKPARPLMPEDTRPRPSPIPENPTKHSKENSRILRECTHEASKLSTTFDGAQTVSRRATALPSSVRLQDARKLRWRQCFVPPHLRMHFFTDEGGIPPPSAAELRRD